MTTEKLTYMLKIDDPYWTVYEETMEKLGNMLANREDEGIEDALMECGFVRERTCTCKELHYDKSLEEFVFSLSCGHAIFFSNLPSYCPECGAKVVVE